MKTKQILFTKPNTAELVEKEIDAITGKNVLVRTVFSAISAGTERANLIGEANVNGSIEGGVRPFPRSLGYSSSGIIEASFYLERSYT